MANTRKRGLVRRQGSRGELSKEQQHELMIGPRGSGDSAFTSNGERLKSWRMFREELLSEMPPFRRPWAWFHFEAPGPRLWLTEPNENYLERYGSLTAVEKVMLARSRRSGDVPPRPIWANQMSSTQFG